MEENMVVIRDPKPLYSDFDWPKDLNKYLKHEIGLIIKSNKSLAGKKIKKKIQQLFLKFKHGNYIHDYQKQ